MKYTVDTVIYGLQGPVGLSGSSGTMGPVGPRGPSGPPVSGTHILVVSRVNVTDINNKLSRVHLLLKTTFPVSICCQNLFVNPYSVILLAGVFVPNIT